MVHVSASELMRRFRVVVRKEAEMDDQLVPNELLVVGATALALFSATALLLAAIAV
jgi:hypothetical protein